MVLNCTARFLDHVWNVRLKYIVDIRTYVVKNYDFFGLIFSVLSGFLRTFFYFISGKFLITAVSSDITWLCILINYAS